MADKKPRTRAGTEVQHFQVGGLGRAAKIFSNVGKGEKSLEAAQNLMRSGRELSLAERQFVAEVAAKQAEELARERFRPTPQLGSVEAQKSKGPSPKPARAKPKTKAEISAIAERVAPQMMGEFVRAKPGESKSVAGKSKKQWDIEQELQHDMQRSREVPEAQNIDLEPHKGSVMLSLPGDTSIADYDIFGIGGQGLRMPSRQYGGPRFGLGHPEEAGWASGLDQAAAFQRRVNAASGQYGDVPVLANYLAMGPQGLNYATHYTDALLKAIDTSKMRPKDIEHFNRIIRYGSEDVRMPDFPGIENPEAAYLYLAQNPIGRKLIFNPTMQLSGTTEGLGLPSGLNVRHAITEPELRDLEPGMTGFSMLQMEPGVANLKPSMHPTYSHDIPGKFLGRTDILYPYEMTFPDTLAEIRANPRQAKQEFGTLQFLGGKQVIDQQLLDELGEYRRRIKELTGKAEGGDVSKDDVDVERLLNEHVNAFKDPATGVSGLMASKGFSPLEGVDMRGMATLIQNAGPKDIKDLALTIELAKRMGIKLNEKGLSQIYGKLSDDGGLRLGYSPKDKSAHLSYWAPFAEGGGVHMGGGGNPGEVSGDMFKPKPLTIPEPLTDLADAFKRQFSREKRSMSKPGALTDVLLRGPVALTVGAPMDIIGMGGDALDWLQTKIPGLRERSVMDQPRSVVDKSLPVLGYQPKFKIGPEGDMPFGSAHAQELMNRSGLTTGEERPLLELGSAIFAPGATAKALKYGKAGAKALAPTAMDIMETQLQRATSPMRMSVVPEGGPVAGKLKAPANDVGFYNPAEKAALNLQRKKGSGSAFVSDLKKTPGVNDERLTELGLGDLASRPEVTSAEVLAATEQNRIPLRESVSRPPKETEYLLEAEKTLQAENRYMESGIKDIEKQIEDIKAMYPNSPIIAERTEKIATLRSLIQKNNERLANLSPARFSPDTHPDWNMPGGENYREIRVGLPNTHTREYVHEWYDPATQTSKQFATQEEAIADKSKPAGAVIVKREIGEKNVPFYDTRHHGNEPNVLFHLRVADHVDAEGKKGLLIDELQSDWHQKGREKGYVPKNIEQQLKEGEQRLAVLNKELNDVMTKTLSVQDGSKEHDLLSQKLQQILDQIYKEVNLSKGLHDARSSGVPDAPFKDNWYQLGLKRAIKEAADTGMDRVYLTTGARQADRYDLSQHVSEIHLSGSNLVAYDKQGNEIIQQTGVNKDNLADYIGKEAAKKLLEQEPQGTLRSLSGLDLKVGGEGMKQWYDRNYKNFLDKYAKQFGAQVGETTLPGAALTRDKLSARDMHNLMDNPEFKKILDEEFIRVANEPRVTGKIEPQGVGEFKVVWSDGTMSGGYSAQGARDRLALGRNKESGEKTAWNAALKRFGGEKVYYIDITPEMRKSAAKGQSYKEGGAVAMAAGGAVDYEARFNKMLQDHVAGMAEGGAVDYESRFNDMLQKHVQGMAEGGEVENEYNNDPDMSDGGRFVQAPAFADGGAVKSIWTVN